MARSADNPWLHRFAVLTALVTLALIGLGGLVTSHEAGMAVPDWPTTNGQNMFLFPPRLWQGNIFFEHTHRLLASAVGLLTAGLAIWLWLRESRAWLRWLGVIAFFGVVLQGVLGGLRVVLLKNELGIVHAGVAQSFLALVCAIALFTGSWWRNLAVRWPSLPDGAGARRLLLGVTLLIFAQLLLGATMRHQHAGLAIPDFPLAYHKLWPAADDAAIASYNAHRLDVQESNPITAFQVYLQMAHRLMAALILCAVAFCAWATRRSFGPRHPLAAVSLVWLGLILAQVFLGAATIWTGKAPDIATLHVVVGAVSLVTGSLLTIVSFRVLIPARATIPVTAEPAQTGFVPGKPAASGAK